MLTAKPTPEDIEDEVKSLRCPEEGLGFLLATCPDKQLDVAFKVDDIQRHLRDKFGHVLNAQTWWQWLWGMRPGVKELKIKKSDLINSMEQLLRSLFEANDLTQHLEEFFFKEVRGTVKRYFEYVLNMVDEATVRTKVLEKQRDEPTFNRDLQISQTAHEVVKDCFKRAKILTTALDQALEKEV